MGAAEYSSEYIRSLGDIVALPASCPGKYAEVTSSGLTDLINSIKLSVLYNECSIATPVNSDGEQCIQWLAEQGIKENLSANGQVRITVPTDQEALVSQAVEQGGWGLGFWMPAGNDVDQLLNDLSPLVSQERVLIRPRRVFFVRTGEKTEQGGNHWHGMPAAPGTSPDSWEIEPEPQSLGEQTVTDLSLEKQEAERSLQIDLSELSLPYLTGVSLSDYAKILDDEHDLIVEFRNGMRTLVAEGRKAGHTIDEIRRDLVEPRIAKINRSFNRISNAHRMKVGGAAFATATLTLTTLATGGLAAAVTAAAGGAGLVTTFREIAEYRDKLGALKDDPLHLLWRLKAGGQE